MPSQMLHVREIAATEKWQQILADLITDPKELLQILQLDPGEIQLDESVLASFPLKATRPYVARIEKRNWQDPLLRQILPLNLESQTTRLPDDPLQEAEFNPTPGLLQKYSGRVLLTVAPHCAIHCRYCFRRQFDYQANSPSRQAWSAAIDYIAKDATIREVIFSGGDPLAVGDRQLSWLCSRLEAIPHLKRLRIHTRTPIVIPQRVTDSLLDWLTGSRLQPVMVLHCNHPRELDLEVLESLSTLATNSVTLLNQSVLLKGVNDSSQVLTTLSEKLFSANVLPYYLHLLDLVPGVGHFEVSEDRGQELIDALQANLPGYLVPKLVKEIAGELAKTRIA